MLVSQAPLESIRGTIEALGPEVDLPAVFRAPLHLAHAPAAGPYKLRSVVCYFGHHYLVRALWSQCVCVSQCVCLQLCPACPACMSGLW